MNSLSDGQLVALAIKGDNNALETLIARYLKLVYGFVYTYVKNSENADDLTQEIFIKIWKNLRKFDQNKPFRPWIYQIAKNVCLDFLKKKSALSFSDIEQDGEFQWLSQNIVDKTPQPDVLTDQNLLAKELALAAKKLSPKYSETISLYHFQNLNFREIAALTKKPLNTIKSQYRRAILLLKKIVKNKTI